MRFNIHSPATVAFLLTATATATAFLLPLTSSAPSLGQKLTGPSTAYLEAGFKNPPASAKPHTWWHWMNGNVTKAGITADLEAMKKIGIGGAQIFNVDVGIPDGKTPMLSAEWSADVQFAIKEAHRLGIEICLHNGAGWSSSGGPWIKPEQGMQFLTWSETPFHGPGQFTGMLKQPDTREGFYRDVAIYAIRKTENDTARIENIRAKAAFERGDRIDPSSNTPGVLAGTHKSDVVIISSSISADGHISWNAPDGDWTIMRFGYTPTGETNHPAPISGRGLECDKLNRSALDTHWAGMMGPIVKGAGSLAGKSLNNCLIDSYEVGTQNWSPQFQAEFTKRRGYDPLPYLPIISGRIIESTEFSERFLWDMRRTICDLFADNYFGYMAETCHKNGLKFSTEPYGNGEFDNLQIGGLADIPMGEFWIGNSAIESTKLASSAGHIYGHPIIGAESFTADTSNARWTIDPYAMKALGDRVFTLGVNRYIFHRYAHQPWLNLKPGMTMGPWGTNLERTVTWWDQGAAWMKYIARCQFLLQSGSFCADVAYFTGDDGPNDLPMLKGNIVPEGYDYDGIDSVTLKKMSVKDGMITLPSGMQYRVLVLPDSAWMTPASAQKIRELVQAGATIYGTKPQKSPSLQNYPNCDNAVAEAVKDVWGDLDGKTVMRHAFGKGNVILGGSLAEFLPKICPSPDCELVKGRLKSMLWIHRKTESAEIYFVSNQRYQPETFDVAFRVNGKTPEIWDPMTGTTTPAVIWSIKNGRTVVHLPFTSAGSTFVIFRDTKPEKHLTDIVETQGGAEPTKPPVIEILSAKYEAVDGTASSDVTSKVANLVAQGETEIDATNANFGDPATLHVKQLRIKYTVGGKPMDKTVGENQELTLIGNSSDTARPDYELKRDGGSLSLLPWGAGSFRYTYASGKSTEVKSQAARTLAISGTWKVQFAPKLGAPPQIQLDSLASWTDNAAAGVKYFSGTAEYTISFDVPTSMFGSNREIYLDLGEVKNFAEVTINDSNLGVYWKPPFRMDVTNRVHLGQNMLRVKVTNLWPNRIIGDEQFPPDVEWNGEVIKKWPDWILQGKPRPASPRITFTTWRVFNKDSALYTSGLLGPAELISIEKIPLR